MRLLKRFLPSLAVFAALIAVLTALGTAMTTPWSAKPLTQHIKVASANSAIRARDTVVANASAEDTGNAHNTDIQAGKTGETDHHANTKNVLKTVQEGTYQVKTTNLHIKLAPNVTINAILRSPIGAPGRRPAVLFIHGAGTGKASEVYGDIASAMSSAGIVTLVPDKRLDTYTTFHRDYYAMAEDYMTSLKDLRAQPDVNSAQAGIYAESEGTWIAEAMAHRHPGAIPFMMLTSPPAVSGRRQMAMAANTYVDYIGAPKGLNRDVDKFISLDFAPLGLQYADFPAERYLKDLTMPLLISFGTDDLSMPIEQGATDIVDATRAAGNRNVLVRYYHANHQMRVGAHTSVPGLPLDTHYTHDLEDWTNAIAAGTKAGDWVTPQTAGNQPHQRFGVPAVVKPGIIGSLSTILVLLAAIVLCVLMAGIVGICIAIGHARKRSKQGFLNSDSKNVVGQSSTKTTRVRLSWGDTDHSRFPHRLTTALTLNSCCAVLGIAMFFVYVIIAAKSALTLTSRGTLLTWGWTLMQVIALINIALLTRLIMELWRSRGSRNPRSEQPQGFWTPAHFVVAALCVIAAVTSLVTMAFFGLYAI
ncbi:acyl-CoA thioester hydrolase/BAAT C-terminal domain-containing protein [Bifidobacterium sp. ESL0732]|uniref:alpha/beta hydrolase family protein n=1 Tax=Bifidobacterium sp. ESL0732 TaxID=2983222 RepID=UPI0023F6BFB6|nr:acyl-CoA thioester hydrolase/BAAT C-terminal domain-containing protein [Bifidobacterium sp. ESL0732]WEV64484.1 hypothetical protein OZX70_02555 [Bifidobacterium sp. ESL0732]